MFEKFRKRIEQGIEKRIADIAAKNSVSVGNEFLRYGSKMRQGWGQVEMADTDHYTGYGYAAIRNRANMVARVGVDVITKSEKDEEKHPYQTLIENSPNFSEYMFWYTISTFMDLEGVYYLFALRNGEGGRIGDVQQFKLLNPYNIRRVIDSSTGEVAGYIESRGGMQRELPLHMIIEIRELNPFSSTEPYAMTDAAREGQFTLKTAGDYTRKALAGNINSPGVVSTDVVLPKEQFANFVERIKGHVKGEPLFANGAGAIKYESMQTDLEKAGLEKINEINRDVLFAVSGVSKTMMGIEQSGTTRETARTQKDLMIENQVLPRCQMILDALNQDFKYSYPNKDEGVLTIINPLSVDYDAKIKDVEEKNVKYELYKKMIADGIPKDEATSYIEGRVEIDSITEPKIPEAIETITQSVSPNTVIVSPVEKVVENVEKLENHDHCTCHSHNHYVDNAINEGGVITQQTGMLKNSIINIEQSLVADAIGKITGTAKNQVDDEIDIEKETDLVSVTKQNRASEDLRGVLIGFFGAVMLYEGQKAAKTRALEFGILPIFSVDNASRQYIREIAKKVSKKHVDTIMSDIFVKARELSLAGEGRQSIARELRKEFNEKISKQRAETIARTETNRAFTRAQYEADRQFIENQELEGRVFKQWIVRSDNPCPFCLALANEAPIPFDQPFRKLGSIIEVDEQSLPISFESLEAGNAHPNCACAYKLIIKSENNSIKEKVEIQNNEFILRALDEI